jgi:excisionase family DNA binding protein
MPDKDLLSVKQVSEYLNLSPCTVYRRAEHGEIPSIKLGSRLRFRKEDIDAWLAERLRKPFIDPQIILNTPPAYAISALGGIREMARKGKTKSRLNLGYGAIYQRKTKQGITRWYLDYRDANGERVQKVVEHAATAQDAETALKHERLIAFQQSYGLGDTKKQAGFRDFASVYLEDYIKVKRRNWQSDRYRLEKLKHFFQDTNLRIISPMMIDKLIALRQKEGNSASTINRYLALLKRMFNLAIEEGYAEQNPVKKIKFFSEAANRRERVLTQDEEKRLMAASSAPLRSVLIIALNTGLRLGEILNLSWNQIDLQARKIRVEKTKSGKPVTVPTNSPLFDELQRLKSDNGRSPHLFFNEKTGKPRTLIRRAFLTACEKAEISGLRFHDLRHTVATRLLEKGIDIETVRSILGHYSITVTQRYVHSNDESKKKAVDLLAENAQKEPQNGGNLLHICDTGKKPLAEDSWTKCVNRLSTMN